MVRDYNAMTFQMKLQRSLRTVSEEKWKMEEKEWPGNGCFTSSGEMENYFSDCNVLQLLEQSNAVYLLSVANNCPLFHGRSRSSKSSSVSGGQMSEFRHETPLRGGTEAGFAVSLINKKLGFGDPLAAHIEAFKEGEEPISFGPSSALVDYGNGWGYRPFPKWILLGLEVDRGWKANGNATSCVMAIKALVNSSYPQMVFSPGLKASLSAFDNTD
ncbi:hypothetical protein Pyn_20154 [Prunus yedoensis var. nudiflora]|uniref:Uncharacterized protein n=1 Tax=Prunus yedoensis var. nudiflora TaxID=2094558 RepID=A0A314Y6T1_PRUYE|nr:hypothetical protein Pyn_20154 [Prunus yedoensis var. nudiflora]